MRFPQKVVWVTGASSGIGAATARAFAAEGARVVLSSRHADSLERVRQTCTRPDEHAVVALDLTRSAEFSALVSGILARFGRIDVLVNNGGVSQRALATEATEAAERAIMEVDYFGTVALTKAVLPSMLERRSGHLAVVSSVMGYVGTPGRSTYAAAKHALHGYFDSLRAEVWHQGIKVTLVCPGYVRTAISDNAVGPRGERYQRTDSSTAGGISPERCAAALLKGVARERTEVYIGGWEVAGIYLQRLAPWLISRLIRRMKFSVNAQPVR